MYPFDHQALTVKIGLTARLNGPFPVKFVAGQHAKVSLQPDGVRGLLLFAALLFLDMIEHPLVFTLIQPKEVDQNFANKVDPCVPRRQNEGQGRVRGACRNTG